MAHRCEYELACWLLSDDSRSRHQQRATLAEQIRASAGIYLSPRPPLDAMVDTAYAIRTVKTPYKVHATLWGPLAEHAQFALLHFLTTPKIKRLETWDHDATDDATASDPS